MSIPDRTVVHLDVERYLIACEQLRDSRLAGQPLIVAAGSGRMMVLACSREAATFGVQTEMNLRDAVRLCPQARIIRGDWDYYSGLSATLTEIIGQQAPLFEKVNLSEFFIDLTGVDKFVGSIKWMSNLQAQIATHSGLASSFGLSVNKTVSKVACYQSFHQGGRLVVDKGTEKPFLAPLSVRRIPGISPGLYYDLAYKGVKRISLLQKFPYELITLAHGQDGFSAWKKAQAIDPAPVTPYIEAKFIQREHVFNEDTTHMTTIHDAIRSMVISLAYELRKSARMTGEITVKIRYTTDDTYFKSANIPYQNMDDVLLKKTMAIFSVLYSRRLLIRMVGVKFSRFVTGSYQISLFDDNPELVRLYQSKDRIRDRFGFDALK